MAQVSVWADNLHRDTWGLLMRRDCPLAAKETISPEDLRDLPLILSHQKGDDDHLARWIGNPSIQLNVVATYNLIFNASLLVSEGLGCAVALDRLINTTGDSDLCFRPLSPVLEAEACIVWKRYQIFSKAAETFLHCLEKLFKELD